MLDHMFLSIIFWFLMVLALTIIIYAIYATRAEFQQARRIRNGAQFLNGAWTPASSKRQGKRRSFGAWWKDERQERNEHKQALVAAHQLEWGTREKFGVQLDTYDIAKLIAQGGALRLNATKGVRYDKEANELKLVTLAS